MPEGIQPINEASEETQKIIEELQKEGHTIEGQDSKPEEKPKDQPPKEEEPKDDPKSKDKPDDTPPKDQQDQSKGKAKVSREPQLVPVGKYNDLRHDLQDAKSQLEIERTARTQAESKLQEALQGKIEKAADHPNQGNMEAVKTAAESLAKKHGVDPEYVSDFVNEIAKLVGNNKPVIPQEIEAKLKEFGAVSERLQRQEMEAAQEKGFADEFSEVRKEFPELDVDSHKDALKQLAFTEGNEQIPLRTLAIQYMHDNPVKGRKTAEPPNNGRAADKNNVIDFDNLTDEQFKNLTDEQLDQYQAYQEKKQRGR